MLSKRASLWRQSGICYEQLQRYAEARVALEQAVALAPADFESHHRLSVPLYFLHDRSGALRESRLALQLNPQSAAAQRNLGRVDN